MDAIGLIMRNFSSRGWKDERATTAVEFAIVGPVFILLVVGMVCVCLALFAVGSLQYAVEEGARCSVARTSVCTDANATIAYTKDHYFGPSNSPAFTVGQVPCGAGRPVSGSTNFVLDVGLTKFNVPISATACFP
jgi:Flp pilus assembly protein TadG